MPLGVYPRRAAVDRFWDKVDRNGPIPAHRPELGPCWVWTSSGNGRGYGRFGIDYRKIYAHRYSYALAHGSVPNGLDVLHACDNPPCVRPEHLFVGTAQDNGRDMAAKGRINPASIAALKALPHTHARVSGDDHWSRKNPEMRTRGEASGQAKLTEAAIVEIRSKHANGASQASLVAAYGVSQATIWGIVRRKTWTHI